MPLTAERFFYHLAKAVATPFIRRSVRIEVVGLENLPARGGAVLVSNHRSDADAAVLSVALPRYIAWVVASYMDKVPVTNWLIQRTGAVLVNVEGNMTRSSFKQAMDVLKNGGLLGIFPEGEGYIFANDFAAPLADFYRGFAVLAVKMQVPVIPITLLPVEETLENLQIPQPIQADIARMQDLDRLQKIARYRSVRVVIGKPIDPRRLGTQSDSTVIQQTLQETRSTMQRLGRHPVSQYQR